MVQAMRLKHLGSRGHLQYWPARPRSRPSRPSGKLVALLRHGAVCQERLAGPSASPIGWTIGEGRKELRRQQQAGWRVRRARAGASQQLAAVNISCLVQIS